jgi:molybdopterin biosynthesis enzyme
VKALAVRKGPGVRGALEGRVVCHDVRDPAGKIVVTKGQTLDARAVTALLSLEWDELHVLELEPGELHEEPAGARLAAAAAGPGVEAKGYSGGQWTLVASRRGLLRVRAEALHAVNRIEGMSVFTLYDSQPVDAGEVVARAKITPLAISETAVKQAEERAWAAGGLATVKPFLPHLVGAVAKGTLEARQRERFEASLAEKLAWFGSRLLPVRYPEERPGAVVAALKALVGEGAQILVAAGAGSLDPLDAVFEGLRLAGGRMERHGAPAHPGSLLWLARLDRRPVLGMPACGMFSQATAFDLVLPRILAGEHVGAEEISALGHGGLLSRDSAWRFPPYRKTAARGELEE